MTDHYFTIKEPSLGEFRDRGSKFLAYAFPVFSEKDWQAALEEVKKEHSKARHHCYAYRLGLDKNNFRANDDGEPSGTAGRPILGQIDSFELTNVFVVVVRYFGGTLLGTSGLINAYKESTIEALKNAEKIEKIIEDRIKVSFDYSIMGDVMNALKRLDLEMVDQDFGLHPNLHIQIRKSDTEKTLQLFKSYVANVPLEQAIAMEKVEGLEIEIEE
ncbi:MAG: YigZ family protein [Saprospiraceae bacterium]